MTAAAVSSSEPDSSQGTGLKVKKGLNEVPASDAPSLVRGDEDPEANQATERDEDDQEDAPAQDGEEEEEGEVQLDDAAFEEVKL